MVFYEHWLWPYELGKLNNLYEELVANGKTDTRLSVESKGF